MGTFIDPTIDTTQRYSHSFGKQRNLIIISMLDYKRLYTISTVKQSVYKIYEFLTGKLAQKVNLP